MLMGLGQFIFEQRTLAPNDIAGQLSVNWQKQQRFQGRPAVQYTGIDAETLTLSGILYPGSGITGTSTDIQTLKDMAATGESFVLNGVDGYFHGLYAIQSVSDKHTLLSADGKARKIEFDIALIRTDDDKVVRIL